jgi:hypothetical protein
MAMMTFRLLFLLTALSFSWSVLAWDINLSWPKNPEATVNAEFSWSGGVAPVRPHYLTLCSPRGDTARHAPTAYSSNLQYVFEVLDTGQSESYFKYEGAAHSATWCVSSRLFTPTEAI